MRLWIVLLCLFSSRISANTLIEFDGQMKGTGLLHESEETKDLGRQYVTLEDCDNLPEEFDLRDLGVVPPIRDQGSCGSCWSFSMTASLESAWMAGTNKMLDLSEQQLVSCDRSNWGCNGGLLGGFKYQIATGQDLETAFPYRAQDVSCKSGLTAKAKGESFAFVGPSGQYPNEKQVKCALFKTHTIPWITVSAGGSNWSNPPTSDDGLITRCGAGGTNHAVGLVGWKTVNGKVYFKMRNSWGKTWGSTAGRPGEERGYALMPLGCDSLGEEVAYIMTGDMPCQPPKPGFGAEVIIPYDQLYYLQVPNIEPGVSYEWSQKQPDGSWAVIRTFEDQATGLWRDLVKPQVLKVKARNECGLVEVAVKVSLIMRP